MICILEGPDGGGKSHLAKQLVAKGLTYHHEGVPPIEVPPLIHYGRVLDGFRGQNVVIDRLALGERVYGPIVRGKDRLGAPGWDVFKRLVSAVNAVQVLCLPSFEVCRKSWASGREELFGEVEKLERVYLTYEDLISEQDVVYDYTVNDFEVDLWPFLEKNSPVTTVLQWNGEQEWLPKGWTGNPYAETVFVGEQVGDVDGIDLPFHASQGSSDYLNSAIKLAGFKPNEYAMVNALRADGEGNNLWPVLEHMTADVIALGRIASRELLKQAVPHKIVPHPQYWKRFRFHEIGVYAQLLREAAGR